MASRAERAAWEAWARRYMAGDDSHGCTDAAVNALLALIGSEECREAVDEALWEETPIGVRLTIPEGHDAAQTAMDALVAWLSEESPTESPNGG